MSTEPIEVSAENQTQFDVDNLLLNAVLEEFPAWMVDQAEQDDCWEPAVLLFGVQIAAVARALERIELNSWGEWEGKLLSDAAESALIRLCAWAVLGAGFESFELSPLDFEEQLPPLVFGDNTVPKANGDRGLQFRVLEAIRAEAEEQGSSSPLVSVKFLVDWIGDGELEVTEAAIVQALQSLCASKRVLGVYREIGGADGVLVRLVP